MDPQEKKHHAGIIIGIVIGLLAIIFIGWWLWPHARKSGSGSASQGTTEVKGITDLSLSPSVYSVALARATAWEPDAALLTMTSGDTTGQTWTLIFTSPEANGQAFEVVVNGQVITSASEISISGTGAPLPQNLVPPDQALTSAHAVPGYASTSITSAKLVYDAAAKQWYWGMKTSSGFTVSVKATQ